MATSVDAIVVLVVDGVEEKERIWWNK